MYLYALALCALIVAFSGCESSTLDALGVPARQRDEENILPVPSLSPAARAVDEPYVPSGNEAGGPHSRLPEFSEGGRWLVGREGGFEGEQFVPGAAPDHARLIRWRYDRDDEITLRGPVLGKRLVNLPGEHTGVVVELQPGGDFVDVLLGTTKFHYANEFDVGIADFILVTGVWVKLPGRDMVVARELVMGDHAVTLRDEDGWPRWYDREFGRIARTSPTRNDH